MRGNYDITTELRRQLEEVGTKVLGPVTLAGGLAGHPARFVAKVERDGRTVYLLGRTVGELLEDADRRGFGRGE